MNNTIIYLVVLFFLLTFVYNLKLTIMNITPKSILKGRNSDGSSFRVEEWDFATLTQLELVGWVVSFIALIVLGSVISPLLLILCLASFNGRIVFAHVIGLIIGVYFLIDCYNGWLCLVTLNLVFSNASINFIVALNVIAIIGHAIFLVFGWTIYKGGKLAMISIITLIAMFGFITSFNVTAKNKDWVSIKLSEKSKPVDTRDLKQIEVDSQNDYESQLKSEGRDPESVNQYAN